MMRALPTAIIVRLLCIVLMVVAVVALWGVPRSYEHSHEHDHDGHHHHYHAHAQEKPSDKGNSPAEEAPEKGETRHGHFLGGCSSFASLIVSDFQWYLLPPRLADLSLPAVNVGVPDGPCRSIDQPPKLLV